MKAVKNWRKATVSDIETDGLLEQLSKLHVVAFQMYNKDTPSTINGKDINRVKAMLDWHIANEIPIVGHNFILYDVPALEKLLNIDLSELIVIDTMALSWYLNPARKKHGLDGFGSDYGVEKPKIDNWEDLTFEEYQHRCSEDVKINKLLWDDLSERLVEIYSKSKEMIDNNLVGGKRVSTDEVIYLDSLKGLSVDDHIERLLTFLSFKMSTYKIQESFGIQLDVPYIEKSVAEVEKIVQDCKDELESILPPVVKYAKKSKPKADKFKKNGEMSVSWKSWEEVKNDYLNQTLDERGNRLVLLGKNETTVIVNGEEMSRPVEDIEEFRILKSYEKANAGSHSQIKDFLFAHGWVPENFKEVEDEKEKAAWEVELAVWKKIKGRRPPKPQKPEPRKVPQITVDGEDGKELCPSVEALAEDYPEISVYSNMNLWAHRLGVLRGFLKNCDETGRIKASAKGFTNTLRMCHAQVVNLVGVDKKGGDMIRGAFIADKGQIQVGSDLASLEDRTKHHFMLPYDPKYVSTMMEDDFDPHLLMAVTAGFIVEKDMEEYKAGNKQPHVTKGRKLGKVCNYSAVYGAGAAKIAQTAKVDDVVGRQLHEAYWNLNWSVQAIAADQALVKLEKKDKNYYHTLWLINPVNGFCYSLRAEKDIFSTLCQGTGSFFFDMWVKNILRRQKEMFGVTKLQLQMHDEIMYSFKGTEQLRVAMEKIIRDSIQDVNEEFLLRRKLDVDVQFGERYSEIH